MRIRSELSARLTNLRPVPTAGPELHERVVATLRPAILSGQLPRGMRLIEEEIAEKLGVSRGPVREALLILAQEGLVTMQPRRGATVVGVTERDIRELYDLRLLLETRAVELAAANARPEDIDYLTSLSERLNDRARGEQFDGLSPVDIVFHRHLLVMANQLRLRAAWERLAGILEALLTITDSSRPHDVRHRHIVQALEDGDPEKAREAIRTHISRAQSIMLDVLRRTARQRTDAAAQPDEVANGTIASGPPAGAIIPISRRPRSAGAAPSA
ncbi:MAG: GntR family transcriptional regulator [Chloroflexi bacterium]|nr:GntR family transcriptional regulator [Chloroflexota bacterium]